ncbi:conserved hypothetical protein [Talaromyces stipitatus ATCC 10500]|uniref:Uncharacterized protein n=1 Tax=Talaromyces stipitatus (strain ATCC 10500 / CBS 375.48 / QM 6759 / NRRL 1006) TaxID=441959 RepID=B8LSW9_TALSN|nr:uncharacterized protein TSTA_064340 [Talaromyces stipitatus ATCC 10500]EED22965.1 conserved hypothetical protein [Talaromyces stipitatus ATCC 10500]
MSNMGNQTLASLQESTLAVAKKTASKKSKAGPKEPKVRKTPACGECKKNKVRCPHRSVIDEHGNIIEGPEEEPKPHASTPAPAPKLTNDGDIEQNPESGATSRSGTAGREIEQLQGTKMERPHRKGAGKRKFDNSTQEDTAEPAQKCPKRGAQEASAKPQERKKPGRKPLQKSPIMVRDTPPADVDAPPRVTQQAHPRGNLDMSIDIAWDRHMVSELDKHIKQTGQKWELLQQTIETAQEQWEDVVRSMESTKQFMNKWTAKFTYDDAYME